MVVTKSYTFYTFSSSTLVSLSIILCLLALLLPLSEARAQVTATTGRTVLSIDETILLQITAKNNSGEPDLSVLEKDFKILNQSQSQNYSLINGKASRTHTWAISLLAKRTGEISIPAIKVDNEKSKAIHLIIRKPSATPGVDGKEAFLKISISDGSQDEFYVQQQIFVKIQLFHRIRFTNATLSELELNNTVIEKLGDDNSYSKIISKHRYNVIERIYAIYPQQSGELLIPAILFNGNAEVGQSFSLFSRPGRQIVSRTKPVKLNILPIPDQYSGNNWLPAEALNIESEIIEDAEVKAHEQAHLSASGGLVRSGAQFTYENGPDGKRYAVGGEVSIDTSKVSGDPQATMLKAQKIRRAALAPADPSSQDRAIAADATSMEAQARTELSQQSSEEQTESAAGKGSETNLSVSDIQQNEKNIRESYQKIQPDQLQQSIHNHVNYFI